MKETDPNKIVEDELKRLHWGGHLGYCTGCSSDKKYIVFASLSEYRSECQDCYKERRLKELSSDDDLKIRRLENVREYFNKRKQSC